jgi:hypothetical protein
MELSNLSGVLSNRKYQGTFNEQNAVFKGKEAKDADRSDHAVINTEEEFRFESMVLREGIKVEVRLGYSNDPNNLETVFIGRVVGVQFTESDDAIQVEMQSLATELVQDIKGLDESEVFDGFFLSDARTGPLLEQLIASPECISFGFWKRGTPDKNINRELLTSRWTWNPAPSSDNIFAPDSHELDPRKFFLGSSLLSKLTFGAASAAIVGAVGAALLGGSVIAGVGAGLVGAAGINTVGVGLGSAATAAASGILDFRGPFSNLKYFMYQSTIWNVFKEMEHRHPDCISSPVPYHEKLGGRTRMTMFFGNPDWLYFARDPVGAESIKTAEINQKKDELKSALTADFLSNTGKLAALQNFAQSLDSDEFSMVEDKIKKILTGESTSKIEDEFENIERKVKQKLLDDSIANGAIRPFRRYHLVTSDQHILANNIKAKSSNTFNAVTIKYAKDAGSVEENADKNNEPQINSTEELTIKLDPLIPDEYVRESVYTYPNCQGDLMAKRYALSHLQKGCWQVYEGDLTILGNPSIKPYDIVFVYDSYSEMYGPIQVRRVTHMFDYEHGFISIITPDLVTTVTEGAALSELHAMGMMAERFLGFEDVVRAGPSPLDPVEVSPIKAFVAKKALGIASFFGAKKLIFMTQFGNPIKVHPLIKDGQAMVAGFGPPGVRENEFIINDLQKWAISRWKAAGETIDDFQNMFKNRQGILNYRGTISGNRDSTAIATARSE